MEILLPIGALIVLLFMSIPVAFAMAGAGMVGIWLIMPNLSNLMGILGTTPFSTVAQYAITTIPLFILMAFFSSSGGLAEDLFEAVANWLSGIRGGLAIATVFACAVFGAMSGASVAAASVMAAVAMPSMRRLGYSETLSSGVVAVGSTLDILIPPSVAMVFYGILTGQSIGKLLIAGIIPGAVLGIFLVIIILIWVTVKPSDAPKSEWVPWKQRWKSLSRTWTTFLLIFVVLGALYTEVGTPTEIGALGAFMAAVIGVTTRRLTWKGALEAFRETIKASSMIFFILIGGMIFGYYMTLSGLPQMAIAGVTALNINRYVIVISIVVAYFIVSTIMDELPLILITVQLGFPIVVALGFDPIWFGVLTMMMLIMGLVFPPVGMIAFVVSATSKTNLLTVYRGCCILILGVFFTTILPIIYPQLALWLPSRMR
jgi:C4-dicarboxylate transporter, DctM subunit